MIDCEKWIQLFAMRDLTIHNAKQYGMLFVFGLMNEMSQNHMKIMHIQYL